MTTGKPWTIEERNTICTVYAAMLAAEQERVPFNKAAIRRATLPQLDGRSAGSYEMKMCNISAALLAADPANSWVKGYKPLPGYQRELRTDIENAKRGHLYNKIYMLQALEETGAIKK